MNDFLSQVQVDEFDGPTEADWADYCEYLDSIGYDDPDEDVDDGDDPDGHSYQPHTWDCPF